MVRNSALAFVVGLLFTAVAVAEDEKGYLGVAVKFSDGKINVVEIQPESPAEKAGLKADDVIEKLGDYVPVGLREFIDKVGSHKPGDKLEMVITREGKEMKINVTLAKRPEN